MRRVKVVSNRVLLGAVVACLLGVTALAQESNQASTAALAGLRTEAMRLTALAQVPEAGRAEAEDLLGRVEALQEAARSQEVARLQAYIAALRSGDSPSVAEEMAADAVSAGAIDLAREREQLHSDVEAFLEAYPTAAGVLRRAVAGVQGVEMFGGGVFDEVSGDGPMRGRMLRVHRGAGFSLMLPYGSAAPHHAVPGSALPRWERFGQDGQSAP